MLAYLDSRKMFYSLCLFGTQRTRPAASFLSGLQRPNLDSPSAAFQGRALFIGVICGSITSCTYKGYGNSHRWFDRRDPLATPKEQRNTA